MTSYLLNALAKYLILLWATLSNGFSLLSSPSSSSCFLGEARPRLRLRFGQAINFQRDYGLACDLYVVTFELPLNPL